VPVEEKQVHLPIVLLKSLPTVGLQGFSLQQNAVLRTDAALPR